MGTQYSHLDLAKRRCIQKMRDAKMPVAVIAAELGRHRSTIHREIRRNFYHDPFRDRWGQEYRGYYCTTADQYARKRRARRAKLALRPELRDHVIAKLRAGWSPQQIAGRLRRDPLPCGTVSHETIYRFIYGPKAGLDHVRQDGGNREVVMSVVGQAAFADGRAVIAGSLARRAARPSRSRQPWS